MSSKQGGKAKPLKQPKADKKEYDKKKKEEEKVRTVLWSSSHVSTWIQVDSANLQRKKKEKVRIALWSSVHVSRLIQVDSANHQRKKEKVLKELKAKAQQKGSFGGSGLKKSGKK